MRRYTNSLTLNSAHTFVCEQKFLSIDKNLTGLFKLHDRIDRKKVSKNNIATEAAEFLPRTVSDLMISIEALSEGIWTVIIAAGVAFIAFLMQHIFGGSGGSSGGGGGGGGSTYSAGDVNNAIDNAAVVEKAHAALSTLYSKLCRIDSKLPTSLDALLKHQLEAEPNSLLSKWLSGNLEVFNWHINNTMHIDSVLRNVTEIKQDVIKYGNALETKFGEFSTRINTDIENLNISNTEDAKYMDLDNVNANIKSINETYGELLSTNFKYDGSNITLGVYSTNIKNLLNDSDSNIQSNVTILKILSGLVTLIKEDDLLDVIKEIKSANYIVTNVNKIKSTVNTFNNTISRAGSDVKDNDRLKAYLTGIMKLPNDFYREILGIHTFHSTLERLLRKVFDSMNHIFLLTIAIFTYIKKIFIGTIPNEFTQILADLNKLSTIKPTDHATN